MNPALIYHRDPVPGKIAIELTKPCRTAEDLSNAYTPGVAQPCLEIKRDVSLVNTYTGRGNAVAVVSDGTAVLGLGNIGPEAGLPVMEGKAVLFKHFADIDAYPICLGKVRGPDGKTDVRKLVEVAETLEPTFAGINLEDIGGPACFAVESQLKERMGIPVFHDDQHGTAVVTCAALINACRLTGRDLGDVKVVFSGAGAAGISIARLMKRMGVKNIIICDHTGAIYEGRDGLNPVKQEVATWTNAEKAQGSLADVLKGADVFVGVSKPNLVSQDMVRSMAKDPIIFACANPVPEIMPDDALAAGAAVAATGRSDFPNQINNVLAFPGIFRGALDVRASDINDDMMEAAAYAIAGLVDDEHRAADYIIPGAFDKRVAPAVAAAVADAARKSGVARA